MDPYAAFIQVAVALALGLLVGLQREREQDPLAGIRTFALITVLGTITALLSKPLGGWIVPAGLLAVAALMFAGSAFQSRANGHDAGLTTEFAALVMYALGVLVVLGDMKVAVVLAGVVVILLHWKEPLHGFVRKMGDRDLTAIMQFVLIAVVILPLLPDQKLGPYGVFNPFEMWLVVVTIVGISIIGYVVYKLVPPTAGTLIAGILGGLISSTATTVSYARRTKNDPDAALRATQAIMAANTVASIRVIVLVAIFASPIFPGIAPPLAIMSGVLALLSILSFTLEMKGKEELPEQENPAQLKTAIVFGILYAVVKLAAAFARDRFGQSALYLVGILSGLTDMDAITLSLSDMAKQNAIPANLAWRIIIAALLSNLVFKLGTIAALGNPRLLLKTALFFSLAIAAGLALIFLWPW